MPRVDIGLLARLVGEELVRYLSEHGGTLIMSSVSPPENKEVAWGGHAVQTESSDRIGTEEDSDLSLSETTARELITMLRQKQRRGGSARRRRES
jgi:hypothetical protein